MTTNILKSRFAEVLAAAFLAAALLPASAASFPNLNADGVTGRDYVLYGDFDWKASSLTYADKFAVESGALAQPGQFSGMYTYLSGPGVLTFQQRIQSGGGTRNFLASGLVRQEDMEGSFESLYDPVGDEINSVAVYYQAEPRSYGSMQNWTQGEISFGDGKFAAIWEFWRHPSNGGTDEDEDAAWISQVNFQPTGMVTVAPSPRTLSPDAKTYDFDFTSNVNWTATVAYTRGDPGWLTLSSPDTVGPDDTSILRNDGNDEYSGIPLGGKATLRAEVDENDGAARTAVITFTWAQTEDYPDRKTVVTIVQAASDAYTNIQSGSSLNWKPDSGWFEQDGTVRTEGGTAAQSGVIGPDKTTAMEADVVGPGTISFFWSASGSPSNTLTFSATNTALQKVFATKRIFGETTWNTKAVEYTIPAGNYTLKWEYKVNSTSDIDSAWLADVLWMPSFETYETTISARTSTIREMNVKVVDPANSAKTKPAKIHYRAPVTKRYTILMAHARDADTGNRKFVDTDAYPAIHPDTTVGYARMWSTSDKEKAFTLNGEHMVESGKTIDGKRSPIGAKGLSFPVEFTYSDYATPTAPALIFSGIAALDPKFGNVSGYTGVVYGANFKPACCTVAAHKSGSAWCAEEQGGIVGQDWLTSNLGLMSVAGVYYPKKYVPPQQEAHFFGTFTARYMAKHVEKFAKNTNGDWSKVENAFIDLKFIPNTKN